MDFGVFILNNGSNGLNSERSFSQESCNFFAVYFDISVCCNMCLGGVCVWVLIWALRQIRKDGERLGLTVQISEAIQAVMVKFKPQM